MNAADKARGPDDVSRTSGTRGPTGTDSAVGRPEHTSSVDEFLASVAARERSQGRLSIASLTAASCASQLEAQCREVLALRRQAPGPDNVTPLIAGLQGTREQLTALMHRAFAMETASAHTLRLLDAELEARLRKEVAHEAQIAEFVTASLEAAAHIGRLARLARRVRKLRREVRGGSPTEDALLGAASVAVLDVLHRALRMSRVRDPALRSRGMRALARLRALSVVPMFGDSEDGGDQQPLVDRARRN